MCSVQRNHPVFASWIYQWNHIDSSFSDEIRNSWYFLIVSRWNQKYIKWRKNHNITVMAAVFKNSTRSPLQCQSDNSDQSQIVKQSIASDSVDDKSTVEADNNKRTGFVLGTTTEDQPTRRPFVGIIISSPGDCEQSSVVFASVFVRPWVCIVCDNSTQHCCRRLHIWCYTKGVLRIIGRRTSMSSAGRRTLDVRHWEWWYLRQRCLGWLCFMKEKLKLWYFNCKNVVQDLVSRNTYFSNFMGFVFICERGIQFISITFG